MRLGRQSAPPIRLSPAKRLVGARQRLFEIFCPFRGPAIIMPPLIAIAAVSPRTSQIRGIRDALGSQPRFSMRRGTACAAPINRGGAAIQGSSTGRA